jgi:hypothetical protein
MIKITDNIKNILLKDDIDFITNNKIYLKIKLSYS